MFSNNKLGFISLAVLALNFAISHVQAKSNDENIVNFKKVKNKVAPIKDHFFLSIHKIDDEHYISIVMVKPLQPSEETNKIKSLTKVEGDTDKFPLSTSRSEVKKWKKLTSLRGDLSQEGSMDLK